MPELLYSKIESAKNKLLTDSLGISSLTAQLLVRRGITSPEAADKFLNPKLSQIYDPSLLPNMSKAVGRIDQAITNKEKILIWADYDCDGLGGSSILFKVLSKLGADVSVYVPDRNKDGYGVRIEGLEKAHKNGIQVVITVDSGITAIEPAKYCNSKGIALIITDHHDNPSGEYPEAYATIHPRLPESRYPMANRNPCGTAVAFKLAWAIGRQRSGGPKPTKEISQVLMESLGEVALGSIADVVDLIDENRTLVKHGLKSMEQNPSVGFGALIDISKVEWPIDSTQIGFKIAPRINAAGRMGDATRAFNLLTSGNAHEAAKIAKELDSENNRRKDAQKKVYSTAVAEVYRLYGTDLSIMSPGIVIALENTPVGLVGIIASKLVDDLRRPVLVLSSNNEKIKGSGRTIRGISLLKCLKRCHEHLDQFGGHAMACGLTLKKGRLDQFRQAWSAAVEIEAMDVVLGQANLHIDAILEIDSIDYGLIEEINQLEPFGAGNPAPLFCSKSVYIDGDAKQMGEDGAGHCSFKIRTNEHKTLRGVVFSKPDLAASVSAITASGALVDLVYRPMVNNYQGRKTIQLEVSDIKVSE